MTSHRAPKQWSLSSNETITSIEAWENNLKYILSLDPNFADFLTDGSSWGKKTNATPLRGFSNDPESVPTARRRTAAQKVTHLEMMLGQIANYAPIISRNSIVKNSTSISGVWQSIRQHYGLQLTGSRFLDFANISLKPEQRPEDLFQTLTDFIEHNLLTRSSGITHYGEIPDADEELSPSLDKFIVLTWLRLLHPNLPRLVKQRYGTELRSRTLASVKPEISQALESLLDELHTSDESKVLRSAPPTDHRSFVPARRRLLPKPRAVKSCPLCQQAGRPDFRSHFLSGCKFLPEPDRLFMSKIRQVAGIELEESSYDYQIRRCATLSLQCPTYYKTPATRRVNVSQSPFLHAFYGHHPLRLTIDTGAETNMMRASLTHYAVRACHLLRAPNTNTTVWPGEFLEIDAPSVLLKDATLAVEPRMDSVSSSHLKPAHTWPQPDIVQSIGGKLRLLNNTEEPLLIRKNDHLCQARLTVLESSIEPSSTQAAEPCPKSTTPPSSSVESVHVDPDGHHEFQLVFDPRIPGYNGAAGPIEGVVNMGPVEPPQRKGRVPQYSRDQLDLLQTKFDELEAQGIFSRPEDLNVVVEYLNPSFLVKKRNGGFRLVTAFTDVGRYSKPQPSLMPDVDSTLLKIACWKYIVVSDLSQAFYQIPLAKNSMKYCGVVTPFKGVRVYTRCAMGIPGSETALEELMCRVLGDLLQEGCVAKIADDLYCGGNSHQELLLNWRKVLSALDRCNLRLSPAKTIICPASTTILGWIWSQGSIRASSHRVAALASCEPPKNVRGLRAFVGSYEMLGRVLSGAAKLLAPLESLTAGRQSQDTISWSDELLVCFRSCQEALTSNRSITLPKPDDQLWIATDGSVKMNGLGATLYVLRDQKLHLAGYFSAKFKKHQASWLPCEIEALSIAAAVKHFAPYIIQSKSKTYVLTDSKPCVQAFDKLCRGQFSSSPRVTSFLSSVSRYQITLLHLAGSANLPSDFASRNAPACDDPRCQVCSFVSEAEDLAVRPVSVHDVLSGKTSLPFTSRSAWLQSQLECPDLRRVHSHLKQGTRPSKKLTNIKDVKRYLNLVSISRDGLLVVKRDEPFAAPRECIVIPRSVVDGFLAALHVKLDHPSRHQMKLVSQRYFFALDLDKALDRCSQCCHLCSSLKKVPSSLIEQSTSDPPDGFGISFAADIIKRYRQLVLVVRETSTSFTAACLLDNERRESIRSGLLRLCLELRPLSGPPSVIRVDPAPGFASLGDDEILKQYGFAVEVGRVKNPNKNPVAEKCVAELGDELLRVCPEGGTISPLSLAVATANLNTRIRNRGLSAREMWLQRDQFTNAQIPFSDLQVVRQQQSLRLRNHPTSERSKAPGCCPRPATPVQVGDLVYITSDGSKTSARNRYLVVSVDGLWCNVRKFTGSQLRSTSYRVKLSECYRVPDLTETTSNLSRHYSSASYPEDTDEEPLTSEHVDEEPAPLLTPQSTPSPAPAVVPSELATPPDPQPDIHHVPESSPPPSGSMTVDIDAHIPEPTSSPGPRRLAERLNNTDDGSLEEDPSLEVQWQLLKNVFLETSAEVAGYSKGKIGTGLMRIMWRYKTSSRSYKNVCTTVQNKAQEEAIRKIPQQAVKTALDIPPIQQEVKAAIAKLKRHKAPGVDGVPEEVYKNGIDTLLCKTE
ncbi:uncharacterized protein [Montipora capricornis]|uniref:uncharacterized protein n=1 Tax=Montipora capricornis TaxID=246305 RepID=UPI0035F1D042